MSDGTTGTISVTIANGVADVVIDNVEQRNALTRAMCVRLCELMPELDTDPDVIVITVRGAGAAFSAGATINDLASVILDVQPDGGVLDHLSLADAAIAGVAKPTVALVDGICMGGGWQLASACDFIVASARSVLAVTPAKIGVVYPRAGIERLVRQVGPATAKRILFTGDSFSADEAQQLGLISLAVSDEDFVERTTSLVEALRTRSQFSIHTMKRLIDLTARADAGLDAAWADAWAALHTSPDLAIGIDAFLTRRTPDFAWRPPSFDSFQEDL